MLFSVIVPIYNVEKYLRQCVDSILSQSYSDFELILVDDGSPDACPQICDEYAQLDSRVHVIHKENGGLTSARKSGIALATGEYILAVDGDDYIDSNLLSNVSDIISKHLCDIICFDYTTFPKTVKRIGISEFAPGIYDKNRIKELILPRLITDINGKRFPPSIWSKVFKRDLIMPIQSDLPNEIIMGEDSCVSYVAIYRAESLFIMHRSLYNYRVENTSITRGGKILDWHEPLLRAEFYMKYMPKDMFEDQVARITAHSLFNVAISVLNKKKYRDAKKEIKEKLSQEIIQRHLAIAKFCGNTKEKIALFCLRRKRVFLMKLLSKYAS